MHFYVGNCSSFSTPINYFQRIHLGFVPSWDFQLVFEVGLRYFFSFKKTKPVTIRTGKIVLGRVHWHLLDASLPHIHPLSHTWVHLQQLFPVPLLLLPLGFWATSFSHLHDLGNHWAVHFHLFFKVFIYVCVCLWLCWVSVAASRL